MSAQIHPSTCASIVPMLAVTHAAEAIAFYQKAFGAVEILRLNTDDGRISHAELRIGDARMMLADEFPEIDVLSPTTMGGSPVLILLEVDNVDTLFPQALEAGATLIRPLAGDNLRNGKLRDPFGHQWMILTRNPPE